jgi:hypothetical protein
MQNKTQPNPTRSKFSILRQICNWIPAHLVAKLARETGVEDQSRTFSPWSHVVSLLFAQLTHSIGLNDVCDGLRLSCGMLSAIRGATPPSRNNLSHANRTRDAGMAEKLFWAVLGHLQALSPGFAQGRRGRGLARRFRRTIHVVDSTTIQLIARCMDWARHRRRKAAAKCHMRLDLQSLLPRFAIVDTGRENDAKRARELCAGIHRGEIVIFDKAYVDFGHLADLSSRGISWVTRAKENLQYKVENELAVPPKSKILRDEFVRLTTPFSHKDYPELLRRIEAVVEIDGENQTMVFLTNNLEWSPTSATDLYRCRWQIEAFFKQIKQTLQLADFLGHNANAVRWQVWTALLVYVLLKYQAFLSQWNHSFTRLFTLLRAALWKKLHLQDLLESYGTAGGSFRFIASPHQAYLPGFT